MPRICNLEDVKNKSKCNSMTIKKNIVSARKIIKLDDINKNGCITLNYDINCDPCLEIKANDNTLKLTSEKIIANKGEFEELQVSCQKVALEKDVKNLYEKMDGLTKLLLDIDLEKKFETINNNFGEVCDKFNNQKIKTHSFSNIKPNTELFLVEHCDAEKGNMCFFNLADKQTHLYCCYDDNHDTKISSWKKIVTLC